MSDKNLENLDPSMPVGLLTNGYHKVENDNISEEIEEIEEMEEM